MNMAGTMRCTPAAHDASTRRRNGTINVAAFGLLSALVAAMIMAGGTDPAIGRDQAAVDAHDEPQMMALEAIGPIMQVTLGE